MRNLEVTQECKCQKQQMITEANCSCCAGSCKCDTEACDCCNI